MLNKQTNPIVFQKIIYSGEKLIMEHKRYTFTVIKDMYHEIYIGTVFISPVETKVFYSDDKDIATQFCIGFIDSLISIYS